MSPDPTADAASPTVRQALTTAELDHHGVTSHEVYTDGFHPTGWDDTGASHHCQPMVRELTDQCILDGHESQLTAAKPPLG